MSGRTIRQALSEVEVRAILAFFIIAGLFVIAGVLIYHTEPIADRTFDLLLIMFGWGLSVVAAFFGAPKKEVP